MAVQLGISRIQISGTTVGHMINATFSTTNELVDVTSAESTGNSREFVGGILNQVMSGTLLFNAAATITFEHLRQYSVDATSISLTYTDLVSGQSNYAGSAYVRDISHNNGGRDSAETCDVTFQITGAITEGTEA